MVVVPFSPVGRWRCFLTHGLHAEENESQLIKACKVFHKLSVYVCHAVTPWHSLQNTRMSPQELGQSVASPQRCPPGAMCWEFEQSPQELLVGSRQWATLAGRRKRGGSTPFPQLSLSSARRKMEYI